MSDEASPLSRAAVVPAGPAPLSVLMDPMMAEVAGPGAEPVSVSIDYGPAVTPGQALTLEGWVDRATRTIVFARGRALTGDGGVAAQISAVFRRGAPPAGANPDKA
jgi:acyl-coenzyme A thioesterase PaaI-like protein